MGHIGFADPVCPTLVELLARSAREADIEHHVGGTYVCIEGPQFSTRAESRLYRSWGVSVIGMTQLTEAKLAREAEIAFATIAMATDYDVWHESEEDVSVEGVLTILRANVSRSKRILRLTVPQIATYRDERGSNGYEGLLATAVMTPRHLVPRATTDRLALLLAPYWKLEEA